ncbi:MAG TPA: hypothetical protein VJR94_00530 [Candidatus Nitrosocosmicus sp.]|nr:hypothetical protein [Candidatus Nitrosocosmicus sp.]
MHQSTYFQASAMYVNEILKRDEQLLSEMSKKDLDDKNIYRIFRERLALYERAANMPLVEEDKRFLDYRKGEVCHELRTFRFTKSIKNLSDKKIPIDKLEDNLVIPEITSHL